jgi:hypothetical protein
VPGGELGFRHELRDTIDRDENQRQFCPDAALGLVAKAKSRFLLSRFARASE